MTKPSERIVVFVTTAQKRAIAATAENLGISVSELMRRAVRMQPVARGTRHARAALPAALQTHGNNESAAPAESAAASHADELLGIPAGASPEPLLPAGVLAALTATAEQIEAAAAAEAVARVAAAKAASIADSAQKTGDVEAPLRNVLKRPRLDATRDDDDPQSDPSAEGGRFA
jgi:hypothetical protein